MSPSTCGRLFNQNLSLQIDLDFNLNQNNKSSHPEEFHKKGCSQKFGKIYRENTLPESRF